MATISFQEGSKRWQAKIRIKGRKQQSKTFRLRSDAVAWARQAEDEIARGAYVSTSLAERTIFSEIVHRFVSEHAPLNYRVRSDGKEAWRFQCKHLTKALGQYSMAALTPPVIKKYMNDRLKMVSGATVRKEINLLSKIIKVAAQDFEVALPGGNPVANVRKPSEGKSRSRRLSHDEWLALERECRASRNPWLWSGVQLAVETGMRQGELLQLCWTMIDRKRSLAFLLDPEKIKTGEPRSVPLSPAAFAVLDSLPPSDGAVLPVERMTLYHAFKAACKRAGVEDFTWHDLRHEALSRLAERGDFSILDIASVSGHKTLQMLKRYTHLDAEKLAKKLAGFPKNETSETNPAP